MLSGIGPKEHLDQLGIETIVDLPAVGSNFQEHLGVIGPPFTVNRSFGIAEYYTPENIDEFVTNATGPLMSLPWYNPISPHVLNGYITSKIYNDPTWPDLRTYLKEQMVRIEGVGLEERLFFEIELVRSEQTGTLRLASTNPEDHPIIDPHFLEDPMDVERLVEGIEELISIYLDSKTFQAYGIKWSETFEGPPKCEGLEFPSKEYWRCYVTQQANCALHPTSTCRMGPNNTVAVVDSKLRVFGTTALRIIDSSVMPYAPNGNTNFPSIMIGEMGSRIILNQI